MTTDCSTDCVRNRRAIFLIVLVGMAAHFNSFSGVFLFDDGYTIVNNEKVNDITIERLKLGRPLIGYLNAVNHLIDGGNPRGYHLVNLVGHLLASLTLFGLVRRTLLLPRWPERVQSASQPLALASALLWMVHPLQTASVTYIIQRCESMMGLFYLLTLYCFVRGATAPRPLRWYLASIVAALLSNACKEVIVSAPIVIFVYDWVFLAPRPWQMLKRRGWYYVLLTAVISLTFLYWSGKLVVEGSNSFALGFDYPHYSSWQYLMSQTHVIPHYARLSFWPDPLCFDYQDWPAVTTWRDCWLQGSILCALVLFAFVAICLRWWIGFAIFSFFAILGPTSSFMPIQDLIFDHRMYLSLASLICLVVGSGWIMSTAFVNRGLVPPRAMAVLRIAVVFGLVVALSIATMLRNDDYRSRVAMWSDVVKKRPGDVRAMTEVISQIYQPDTVDESLALAQRAAERMPNDHTARYYCGLILFDQNKLDEAAVHFEYASRLRTDAWIYPRQEGLCYLAAGQNADAAEAFRRALQRLPSDNWSKMLLGLAELEAGNTEAGNAIFAAIRDPKDSTWVSALNEARLCAYRDNPNPAQKRLAILYAEAGVLLTEEKKIELLDILAVAYSISGRFDEAQETVKKALALAEEKGDEQSIKVLKFRLERYKRNQTLRFGASR